MIENAVGWEGATEALERFLADHNDQAMRAAFTTFNFDADSFQRSWMRRLRRSRAQVLVLADHRELQRTSGADASLVGFQLAPVGMRRGVFHPKLVLVRAGDDLFASIGSGNLTQGGLGGNLELQLTVTSCGRDRNPVADGIAGVLQEIGNSQHLRIQPTARRFLNVLTADLPQGRGVMSSLSQPLLDQMLAEIPRNPTSVVTILSPWHANTGEQVDASVVGRLRRTLKCSVRVLTESLAGKAPDLPQCQTQVYVGRGEKKPADEDADSMPPRPARLHAKSLVIQQGDRGWWFLGSANATTPALATSVPAGGNVEVCSALPLDGHALKRLETTWATLFRKADGVHRTPSSWTPAPCGSILGGEILPTPNGPVLRLTAISDDVRQALIILPGPRSSLKTLEVPFTKGEAYLRGSSLARLIPAMPNRRQGASSIILDEHREGTRHPFIVTIPLLIDDESMASVTERLDDELRFLNRRWPVARPYGGGDDSDEDPDETDIGLEELSESQHQGQLDRWAEQLHRLAHLLASPSQSAYRSRLVEMCERDFPKHLRHLVKNAFTKAKP